MLACVALAAAVVSAQLPGTTPANPFGDPARASTPHLTVESSISHPAASPGARLKVTLDVTPRRTMHVYAPGKHDYQVVTLALDPQPWATLEPTKYPPSERYYFAPLNETVEVYLEPFPLDARADPARHARGTQGARRTEERDGVRAARVPGLRRQGVLLAVESPGQLRRHGEVGLEVLGT